MGKNDKWDHNYEPDESKPSMALFWKNIRETASAAEEVKEEAEAKAEAKQARRFARSRLGKWWLPIRRELKKSKVGRRWLMAINIAQLLVLLSALFFVRPALNFVFDTWLFPPDYKLTAAQVQQGYDQTQSSGRSAHNEGVAWRGMTEAEYRSNPDCKQSYNFCVMAIPLHKDCQEIYMEFSTSATSDSNAATIEHLTASVRPKLGASFKPGERVVLGVHAKNAKSQYGGVDHIYCRAVN